MVFLYIFINCILFYLGRGVRSIITLKLIDFFKINIAGEDVLRFENYRVNTIRFLKITKGLDSTKSIVGVICIIFFFCTSSDDTAQ